MYSTYYTRLAAFFSYQLIGVPSFAAPSSINSHTEKEALPLTCHSKIITVCLHNTEKQYLLSVDDKTSHSLSSNHVCCSDILSAKQNKLSGLCSFYIHYIYNLLFYSVCVCACVRACLCACVCV